MKLFKHSIKTKGVKNFLTRFFTIATRFGMTPRKYTGYLKRFEDLQKEFSFKTSFPITASVVKEHLSAVSPFADSFVFMPHGFTHVDYSALDKKTVSRHIHKGKEILHAFSPGKEIGFRAPYLRYNDTVRDVLIDEDFLFDSSRTIFVDVPGIALSSRDRKIMEDLYSPALFRVALSLPAYDSRLVEIPVTLPDDEITVDRLHMRDKNDLLKVFQAVAEKIFAHQEMFIMQLHPERIPFLFQPLHQLLSDMTSSRNLWLTDLPSLAAWFKQCADADYHIEPDNKTITWKDIEKRKIIARHVQWQSGNKITWNSEKTPVIFAGPACDADIVRQLEIDGFFITRNPSLSNKCSCVLDEKLSFSAEAYRKIRKELMQTEEPLIFLSRWPENKEGVFCLSGDIDALTWKDFFSRFQHFSEGI